jgi:hypothetical protein
MKKFDKRARLFKNNLCTGFKPLFWQAPRGQAPVEYGPANEICYTPEK